MSTTLSCDANGCQSRHFRIIDANDTGIRIVLCEVCGRTMGELQ